MPDSSATAEAPAPVEELSPAVATTLAVAMVNGHRFLQDAFIKLSSHEMREGKRFFHAEIICDGRTRYLDSVSLAIGVSRHADEKAVMAIEGIDTQQLFLCSRAPLPWPQRLRPAPPTGRCGEFAMTQARQIQIVTDTPMTIVVDGKPLTRTPATFTFLGQS